MFRKTLFLLMITFLLGACEQGGGEGFIALEVKNARAPEGIDSAGLSTLQGFRVAQEQSGDPVDPLVVTKFKVTIAGEGIDPPITVTADASATQIEVLEIPKGPGRIILIEAYNGEGMVIRRRQLTGVTIKGGVVTPIKTSLNTIPLILNLKSGNIVLVKNFKIVGFGEPAGSLSVDAQSSNQSVSMNQSVEGFNLIVSPSVSDGLFEFDPPVFLMGQQTITLTDEATGESSSVSVTVIDGSYQPGRRLTPTGTLGPALTGGTSYGASREGHFPKVLRALSGQAGSGEDGS